MPTTSQIITTAILTGILLGVLATVGMLGFLVNHENREDCPACTCPAPVSLGENADFGDILNDAALGNDLLYSLQQVNNVCIDECLRRYCKGQYQPPPNTQCPIQFETFQCCISKCTGHCPPGCFCPQTVTFGPTASAA
jgi:hypothetical protein